MNKIWKTLLIVAALCGTSAAQAQEMGEMTKAMFRAYELALAEDPQDYITYYRRAVQYYVLGRYDRARLDLDEAIRYTPAKDGDMLAQEYSLLADLECQAKNYDAALAAINRALTIDPKSYANIYKKGNIYLDMKNGADAYTTFKSMLNLRSRSQEAFFGMARAAIIKGDIAEARTLAEEAKKVDTSSPVTYCRIGDIDRELGDNDKAVVDYLTAISLSDNDISRPLNSLDEIAVNDYDALKRGFDYAISQAGAAQGSLRYIRGVVCYNSSHYEDAYDIFNELASNPENLSSGFLTRLADTCLTLDRLEEARKYADQALTIEPMAEAYLVKSAIERASGNPANAVLFASKAYLPSDPDIESLLAMAKAYISRGDAEHAASSLGEAILLDGDCIEALLLRAYVKQYMQNDVKSAKADLDRAASVEARTFPEIAYRAIAQTLSGKTLDGESSIVSALQRDSSADALCGAAIYYAQTGNKAKAEDYKNRAIDAGCERLFLLNSDKTPYLSLSTKR